MLNGIYLFLKSYIFPSVRGFMDELKKNIRGKFTHANTNRKYIVLQNVVHKLIKELDKLKKRTDALEIIKDIHVKERCTHTIK